MNANLRRYAVPPLSLLFVFLAIVPAFAQPIKVPKAPPPADQGTALFRGLFHFYGVKPVSGEPRNLRECILVVLGSPSPTQEAYDATALLSRRILEAGGSVLIASDSGFDAHRFFPGQASFRMLQGPVRCTSVQNCLNGNEYYPLISMPWPLDKGVPLRIATNSPGAIRHGDGRMFRGDFVASFPEGCRRPIRELAANEVFAAGGGGTDNSPHRYLLMGDQKVFSNQLLYASAMDYRGVTPDNFRFANEVVKWLTADGTRKQCIFIENGQAQPRLDDFDFTALPLTPPKDVPFPPLPSPLDRQLQEKMANMIDQGLAKFEDDERIHQALKRDNRFYGGLLAAAVIFGLSVALVLFARRTYRARHSPDYQPLPADPLLLGNEAPAGSFEHRRLELMRAGDFRVPVVAYLRRMFESRGLPHGSPGGAMPPLEIRARNRGELKAMIRELWEEAFVFDRDPLPYTRWKEIEQSLAAVKSAAEGDLWRFRSES